MLSLRSMSRNNINLLLQDLTIDSICINFGSEKMPKLNNFLA